MRLLKDGLLVRLILNLICKLKNACTSTKKHSIWNIVYYYQQLVFSSDDCASAWPLVRCVMTSSKTWIMKPTQKNYILSGLRLGHSGLNDALVHGFGLGVSICITNLIQYKDWHFRSQNSKFHSLNLEFEPILPCI